jgi:hypothetical protein
MATPEQYPWQQQPNESIKAFQAFVTYRNLEPQERSLQRVASELAKSLPIIKRWSAAWDWLERAASWDDFQELRRLEARIAAKQRMDERHLKIISEAMKKVIQAVQQADPEELARNFSQQITWMSELMRLERMIRGEPESIEERREKLEVKASSQEELRVYVSVFQELLDEGAITLDAVGIPAAQTDADGDDYGEEDDENYDEDYDEPIAFEE